MVSAFLVEMRITADIHVRRNLANITYDVWDDQYKRWLIPLDYLWSKLLLSYDL